MPRNIVEEEIDKAVKALYSEFEYQNSLPRRTEDEADSVPAFLTLLDCYVRKTQDVWANNPGTEQLDTGSVQVEEALHGLRKIAAIAIRGMIYNGIRERDK